MNFNLCINVEQCKTLVNLDKIRNKWIQQRKRERDN